MNVRTALDQHKGVGPGFHFLRHILAIAIVAVHCRQVIWWSDSADILAATGQVATGLSRSSEFTVEDIVRPALHSLVGMFFALSGFLVAGSAIRTRKTGKFLTNRALRIFPALGVETLLSALILGPIVTVLTLGDYFTDPEFLRYFGNIFGFVYFYLPGVFVDNPLPRVVNGQLWTLPAEFYCYLLMAFGMIVGIVYRRNYLFALWVVALIVATVLYMYDPLTFDVKGENRFMPWYITFLFWFGVVYFIFADKIPLSFPLFLLSCVLYWASIFFNALTPLSGVPLTYMMVYLGLQSYPLWDRLVKSDYSYGIYLYHFPLIQMVMWLLNPTAFGDLSNPVQFLFLFPVAMITSTAFAAVSWRYIEAPALALKSRIGKPKPAMSPSGHEESSPGGA